MDDTVLQTHRVNPKLIQVILLANGRSFVKSNFLIFLNCFDVYCTHACNVVNETLALRIALEVIEKFSKCKW